MKNDRKLIFFKISIYVLLMFVVFACSSKKEEETKTQPPVPVQESSPEVVEEEVYEEPVSIVTYGVQIGAYKMFEVEFQSDVKNIKKNGLSYYVVGNFTSKNEADEFLKIMIDLGMKDAFVVKVKDHKIIESFY